MILEIYYASFSRWLKSQLYLLSVPSMVKEAHTVLSRTRLVSRMSQLGASCTLLSCGAGESLTDTVISGWNGQSHDFSYTFCSLSYRKVTRMCIYKREGILFLITDMYLAQTPSPLTTTFPIILSTIPEHGLHVIYKFLLGTV